MVKKELTEGSQVARSVTFAYMRERAAGLEP